MAEPDELLTTTQVAERFKVDPSVVRKWVLKGQLIPHITTMGGHHRFREKDIAAYEQKRASA